MQKTEGLDIAQEVQLSEADKHIRALKAQIDFIFQGFPQEGDLTEESIIALLKKQKEYTFFMELQTAENKLPYQQIIKLVQQKTAVYVPTSEETTARRAELAENDNESNWTDATQSVADGEDDIWVVDDDVIAAMEYDSGEEEGGEKEGKDNMKQDSDQKSASQEKVDLQELEEQFVVGEESNHDSIYGQHKGTFCVSVGGTFDKKFLFSGGGDDILSIYHRTISEGNQLIKPIHTVKHSQTVTKIQPSFDSKFVFSMTEKELNCTNLETMETTRLIQDPVEFAAHKMGGVLAVANGYNIDVYNIKGYKLFDSYCLDAQITLLSFTDTGKQIVAVCDNKLRIVTPKTSEVVKVGGAAFHKGEITSVCSAGNIIVTGCIDGFLHASSLGKGAVLAGSDKLAGSINNLCMADNYFICGPLESHIHWFDTNKMKRLFQNDLIDNSTDIISVFDKNTFAVSDIKGNLYLYDRRSPLKEIKTMKAGNTVHELWSHDSILAAACEDGCIRTFDLKFIQDK